jgi:hypothetical protein
MQLATYSLPHMTGTKTPNIYIFASKMALAVFAETLDNFQLPRKPE